MAGAYAYTSDIWPPLVGIIFMAAIGLYSWKRRGVPAAPPLVAVSVFGALWMLGIALEATAVAPGTKIAWFKFQSLWRAPTASAGLCFVLEYAYPGRWLTRRNLTLLSIPVLLDILLVLTNDSQLMWYRLHVGPYGSVVADLAPAGVIMAAYGVGLVLVNSAVLLWLFIRSPLHRWPVALMLFGHIFSRVLYVVDAAHVPWLAPLDPMLLGLLVSCATYAIALFGFHIFDPVPAARAVALEQMRDGMVVLDPGWRVASVNGSAAGMLGVSLATARGKRPAELLPELGDVSARLRSGSASAEPFEISLGSDRGRRSYEVDVSPLRDFRGLLLGYLLLLRDVTEQQRAQAQIVHQQRSLAMLGEREQLARELHDGIGQMLGFASLKVGAARKLIADGKPGRADDQLVHLENMIVEAHADVREDILNLRTGPAGDRPFFSALRSYLDGYRQNYGIRVDLIIGTGVDEIVLAPEAQMQLFRIVQEAFSNARKHAQTDSVRTSFDVEDCLFRVRIEDNGRGFDPVQIGGVGSDHFGLRFMRERAEQLGGTLRVDSAPGAGTCVEVTIPVGDDKRLCEGSESRR